MDFNGSKIREERRNYRRERGTVRKGTEGREVLILVLSNLFFIVKLSHPVDVGGFCLTT